MPSEAAFTGRCYCGACRVEAMGPPETVAFCHCKDCRRWTGAPAPAFAAFPEADVRLTPALEWRSINAGVYRINCPKCGSPLLARFDYLPGQVYVPLGVLDQAGDLPAEMHCHYDSHLPWLCIQEDLPRHGASGRADLNDKT